MKEFRETVKESFYYSNAFRMYFENAKIMVMDIETTGLSPDRCEVILGGSLEQKDDGIAIHQFFAESKIEEPALVQQYLERLREADVLISFNGSRFDLPFLIRRSTPIEKRGPCFPMTSMDLYRCCRYYSSLPLFLPNLKQKTVETYLGLSSDRTDEISGAESVELYRSYCKTRDSALEEKILLHNRDDLIQLSRLLRIFDKLDLHKILYYEGFPVISPDGSFYVKSVLLQDHLLKIKALSKKAGRDYFSFDNGFQAEFHAADQTLLLEIPFIEKSGYCFVDLDSLPVSFPDLEQLPGFQSGYLILKNQKRILYHETNLFIKVMLLFLLEVM